MEAQASESAVIICARRKPEAGRLPRARRVRWTEIFCQRTRKSQSRLGDHAGRNVVLLRGVNLWIKAISLTVNAERAGLQLGFRPVTQTSLARCLTSRFDANGNATECGAATVNNAKGEINVVVAK